MMAREELGVYRVVERVVHGLQGISTGPLLSASHQICVRLTMPNTVAVMNLRKKKKSLTASQSTPRSVTTNPLTSCSSSCKHN
jgi:hypothetical protein